VAPQPRTADEVIVDPTVAGREDGPMGSHGVARHRALGAVIGSAVGDALGAPFEFRAAGEYRRRFPAPVLGGIGEMTGGGGYGWAPGEFTDDTQMAIVQARSLLACGGIDGADLFARFREWAASANDVGVQTGSVLGSSLGWAEAAASHYRSSPYRSAGNGGLMRATPAAVHFATTDRATSMDAARALAGVTHGDPAAQWGAALYHAMLHSALRGADPFVALEAAVAQLPDDQERFVALLAPDWTPSATTLSNGTVWTCLAQAVWAVRTTSTFEDALVAAIDLGGDTDTVAAVAGGLAGAVHGIQAIPSRWTTYLHGHVPGETLRLAELQHLTDDLIGATGGTEQPPGAALGPVEIAPGIAAASWAGALTVSAEHAVISLCRVHDTLAEHPVRRELYLVDREGDHNPDLHAAVRDAVATIDAFRAEDRPVVVHCHGGASRTGLVLRAWLMRTHGWDEPTATAYLADRWPPLGLWNETFTGFLRDEWQSEVLR
jgi:ADP-ribosyl-[dinitrogen reductase] hydrolase